MANVLLGEAVAVVTADDRIGKVEIFDHGLQLAFVLFGHFATEDHGDSSEPRLAFNWFAVLRYRFFLEQNTLALPQ